MVSTGAGVALASAGILELEAFYPSVLDEMGDVLPRDIAYDLLPRLMAGAQAVLVDGYFRDIGSASITTSEADRIDQ